MEPIYTKEMQNRGDKPPIGCRVLISSCEIAAHHGLKGLASKVATVRQHVRGNNNNHTVVDVNGKTYNIPCGLLNPLRTIEDEIESFIKWREGAPAASIAKELLEYFEIKKKEK